MGGEELHRSPHLGRPLKRLPTRVSRLEGKNGANRRATTSDRGAVPVRRTEGSAGSTRRCPLRGGSEDFVERYARAADRSRSCSAAADRSRTRGGAAAVPAPAERRRTRTLSLRADDRALCHRHRSRLIHSCPLASPCLFLLRSPGATFVPSLDRKINGQLACVEELTMTKIVAQVSRLFLPVIP